MYKARIFNKQKHKILKFYFKLCMYLRCMLLFACSIGLSMYIPWKTEYHGIFFLSEWFKVHNDLWKEMFNTDDEWFHKLSPQLIYHRKGPCQLALKIQILTQDRHQKVAGLNWVMGSQPSLLIDIQRKYRCTQTIKYMHIITSSQNEHTPSHKWMTT